MTAIVREICPRCQRSIPRLASDSKLPHHRCESDYQESHSISQLASHYIAAVSKWAAAGRPVRSEEEILRILNDHCQRCRYFVDDHCKHRTCGCRTNAKPKPLTNKIAMATEHCPLRHW